MESNTELNPEINFESLSAEQENLSICPNCLEPNTDNLAICRYCGMPLHPGAETDPDAIPESEAELAANRAQAVPEEKKPQKKQESGFRRVMPWLGLYIIYYAITGIIETSHQEELSNPTLAYLSWVIYIVAGLLMAWPLIKKGYRKLRHLPEEEEVVEESHEVEDPNTEEATIADMEMLNAAADEMSGDPEASVYSAAEIIEGKIVEIPDEPIISAEAEVLLKKNTAENQGSAHEESIEDEGEEALWL